MKVDLTVNGKDISADVEDRMLLVHFLRDVADLTATNVGCDTTSCGACTVLLDGESVKSCTVLAGQASGHEITTVDVAAVLRPVWRAKPEVARKLYPAIRRVFERARVLLRDEHGIAMPDNPALWADLKAMGFDTPAQLSKGRHPSLPYTQMPEFMADLRAREAIAARALEFLILTNVPTQS